MSAPLRTKLLKPVTLIVALSLASAGAAFSQAIPDTSHLPDFGSRADTVMTKSRERMLGQSVIHQLRRQGVIVDDPQLNEFIRLLGAQLASQVNDGDFDFSFFMIDDDTINAFAMPGGVIGVNTGLVLASDNESELAGVLAHEISHVTQRHIARSMYEQRRTGIMTMASVLAAALLGSSMDSASGDATVGLATAAQAAAAQRQINFTRAHEYEADRIGMGVLAQAGFDPTGMASFFEKLSRRESTALDLIPEMLRTHPTSSGRIAEARGRARQMPAISHTDSLGYGLAKARIRVLTARSPDAALEYYQRRAESPDPADRYGLALSLMGVGLNDTAGQIFRDLSRQNPSVIAFRIGQAEALMADGLDDEAIAVYREANTLSPRNVPLVISFGEALLKAGRADEAHSVLLDLLNNVDNATPAQIELLARAADAEGDRINAHHYMAEYFASVGRLPLAMNQLRTVLSLPDLNRVQRARFEARLAEFQEYLDEIDD